ncbi:TetR family transcriptional regulator [Flavobacterium sp. 9AF]|uniref:TetR/AcrR family transcriptional regulator n=1 Tax=Flavobacterium sp. 9AF TaxID=2653142 RepID=UPI0012F0F887|nr:TetR/AcrR family transcriptional regulator [Flavobacterium sp. 9AF]VXC39522.1 TetR family transcriptional regulator [Flavobacterium sp. 9AF]
MARCVEFNEVEKIEKAMNVFWEKGYNATSMQDLVDAMQINRSSLYNTIGDKRQLFMKCISTYFEAAMCELKQKVAKEKTAMQALINLINDKVASIVDTEKSCLGVKSIFEMASEDVEIRQLLTKKNEVFISYITEIVKKAMEEGALDNSEDPTLLSEYIMTSFTGWKQAYILHRDPIKIKKMATFLIKNISK